MMACIVSTDSVPSVISVVQNQPESHLSDGYCPLLDIQSIR